MINHVNIVLCSSSPRRQQLLRELGLTFEVLVKEVDESFPSSLEAEQVALFLAERKAEAFRNDFLPGKYYITADTIVWLNGEVLGKPVDSSDAFSMLKKLSGNIHQVYTGVCISSREMKKVFFVKSDVQFKKLSDDEIQFYVEHYKPFDKAGSYGAQECLPENMNPCSEEELKFMQTIDKTDLFVHTTIRDKKHMPVIDRIEGGYFNVMGLPVVELWEVLRNLPS